MVLIFASYPQPFFPLSSVAEALFALNFPFLSERCFFSSKVVEINNMGVTGQFLPLKNYFEHACGPRNPPTHFGHDRHTDRHIYILIPWLNVVPAENV